MKKEGLKRNPEAYTELLLSEAEKRKEMMRQVIKTRELVPIEYSVPPKIRSMILDLATKLEQAGTMRPHKICARLEKDLRDQIEDDTIRSSWISEALPQKYKVAKS